MIRPYLSQYKEALIEIFRLNTPQYFAELREVDFTTYLNQDANNYFVVEENNRIVGSGGINYFKDKQLARISWDMIHPDFQGKGIGKQLTLYRINKIMQIPAIRLIEVRTMHLTYQFYQKLGFRLERTEKDF